MNYITRDKVLSEAVNKLLEEMYRRAQPPVDINKYIQQYKDGTLDKDKDHVEDWHYLPMEVQTQIINDYLRAYGAEDQTRKQFEWLIHLFKEGGLKTVYRDMFDTGEKVRTADNTPKLDEIIGEENAQQVYELINDFLGFYRTNHDEWAIRSIIWYCPTTNPETVIEKWGEGVIDDSVYKGYDGEWDYTYKDYIDGKIGEDSWYIQDQEYDEPINEE